MSEALDFLAGQGDPADFPRSVPIAQVLAAIHERSPHARVFLTGYPALFGTEMTDAAGCRVGTFGQLPLYITGSDTEWIVASGARLNDVLRGAARQARRSGLDVRYVDVARTFAGHGVCDTRTAWINPVVLAPTNPPSVAAGSFHPTARGQLAYAVTVARTAARH